MGPVGNGTGRGSLETEYRLIDILSRTTLRKRMARSIRARFAFHLAATTVPLLIVAGAAIVAILLTVHALQDVTEEATSEVEPLRTLQRQLHAAEREVHHYLILGRNREEFDARAALVDRQFALLRQAPFARAEERAALKAAHSAWQRIKVHANAIYSLQQPEDNPQARHQLREIMTATDDADGALAVNFRIADAEVAEELGQAVTGRAHAVALVMVLLCLGLGGAVIAGRSLSRSVLEPVAKLEEGTRRLTGGELSFRVAPSGEDEFGHLASHFNAMADRIERDQHTLRELSIRDGLTGLLNHAEFLHRLDNGLRDAQRHKRALALLLLDIDWFKQVNDRFGHLCGDEALRVVARTLRAEIRPGDEVARYGGEEFAIILRETNEKRVAETAERIRSRVAEARFEAQDTAQNVTISIGVALFPMDAGDSATLVARADQALYRAKRDGRNRVRSYRRPIAL